MSKLGGKKDLSPPAGLSFHVDIRMFLRDMSMLKTGRHTAQVRSVCVGFPAWKRPHVKPFLRSIGGQLKFIKDPFRAVRYAKSNNCRIIIWASCEEKQLTEFAQSEGIEVVRMEDGFLRSVGLGSDFHVPYSLVLDEQGIYYDPSRPSGLEAILEKGGFDSQLLGRARGLRQEIISKRVTKYNLGEGVTCSPELPAGKRIVLVPGQVENDASVLRGAFGIVTNLELLRRVREMRPEAFILYKPHPDVLAGNRPGSIPGRTASKICDSVIGNTSLGSLIDKVDEVHTISSLTGFEALLRGKGVYTYGGPFYAGWGLTNDRLIFPGRRRAVTLDELVAAALILYPVYYDWKTGKFCGPEVVLRRLCSEGEPRHHAGRFLLSAARLFRLFSDPYVKSR